ncbi:uncharacterized protein C8Q71DRAFT_780845 [Rhodofomes roseus]|uniref:Transposase n=1 Tax=Rhodofomes roseus TaxID=34475 RepID=A0ABQ8K4P4_9APHY|nr:uncharacterized protein C8Q71DRAFT_780845 [Rhodofomes roseus]KAH9831863.1 hypothetical protein C8Q71DRAFT_780845 [Rhodofomes roseus]
MTNGKTHCAPSAAWRDRCGVDGACSAPREDVEYIFAEALYVYIVVGHRRGHNRESLSCAATPRSTRELEQQIEKVSRQGLRSEVLVGTTEKTAQNRQASDRHEAGEVVEAVRARANALPVQVDESEVPRRRGTLSGHAHGGYRSVRERPSGVAEGVRVLRLETPFAVLRHDNTYARLLACASGGSLAGDSAAPRSTVQGSTS